MVRVLLPSNVPDIIWHAKDRAAAADPLKLLQNKRAAKK